MKKIMFAAFILVVLLGEWLGDFAAKHFGACPLAVLLAVMASFGIGGTVYLTIKEFKRKN